MNEKKGKNRKKVEEKHNEEERERIKRETERT